MLSREALHASNRKKGRGDWQIMNPAFAESRSTTQCAPSTHCTGQPCMEMQCAFQTATCRSQTCRPPQEGGAEVRCRPAQLDGSSAQDFDTATQIDFTAVWSNEVPHSCRMAGWDERAGFRQGQSDRFIWWTVQRLSPFVIGRDSTILHRRMDDKDDGEDQKSSDRHFW